MKKLEVEVGIIRLSPKLARGIGYSRSILARLLIDVSKSKRSSKCSMLSFECYAVEVAKVRTD